MRLQLDITIAILTSTCQDCPRVTFSNVPLHGVPQETSRRYVELPIQLLASGVCQTRIEV